MLKVKNGLWENKSVNEFIVIGESSADARTATKLAERVLIEQIDWLEPGQIIYFFKWSGLLEGTEFSCWRDLDRITQQLELSGLKLPRYLGHCTEGVPFKADGASTVKILKIVSFLQQTRHQIKAIIFIRDLDNQRERKEGIEQARSQYIGTPKLEIVIGAANPKREAWVLNGFITSNQDEERILKDIKAQLKFDPCSEPERLRSNSQAEPDRIRNPKIVVEQLTGENMEREKKCWEDTSLEILCERGVNSGLKDYIYEVKERLTQITLN
jgi:hypothetical protein